MRDFIQRHFKHFNAGTLADCIESLRDFLDNGGRLMITLAGAMSTAKIGRSLAPAIRSQKSMQYVAQALISRRICSIWSLAQIMSGFQIGGKLPLKRIMNFTCEE